MVDGRTRLGLAVRMCKYIKIPQQGTRYVFLNSPRSDWHCSDKALVMVIMGWSLPREKKKKKSWNKVIGESINKVQVQSGMILWRLGASFQLWAT